MNLFYALTITSASTQVYSQGLTCCTLDSFGYFHAALSAIKWTSTTEMAWVIVFLLAIEFYTSHSNVGNQQDCLYGKSCFAACVTLRTRTR